MTITLITGASRGLGRETARRLVAEGHTVYAAARSAQNAQRTADELGTLPIVVDVTDDETLRAAAQHIAQEHGHLDVLVNNAGISGTESAPADITGDEMARILDTNVVGIVRTLNAFTPLLQRSDCGVVVNVGSGLGAWGRLHDPARPESKIPNIMPYSTSKAAVAMLTFHYARAYPGLRINVVDPGATATELNGYRGFQTVEQGATAIVHAATLGADGPTGTFLDSGGVAPW